MIAKHLGQLALAGGIALLVSGAPQAASAADFVLTSPAFQDGGKLEVKNAGNRKDSPNCVGQNVSPPLQWSGAPADTTSIGRRS